MRISNLTVIMQYDGKWRVECQVTPKTGESFEFTFLSHEWLAWVSGACAAVTDGYRRVIYRNVTAWQCVELPGSPVGYTVSGEGYIEMPAKCWSLYMPDVAENVLARWVALQVARLSKRREYAQATLELTQERFEGLCARYGSHSGRALLEYQGREYAHAGNPPVTVDQVIERIPERIHDQLKAITASYTKRYDQVARCLITCDLDGFNFQVYAPNGKRGLNGGIVNHGTDSEPSWSIHT